MLSAVSCGLVVIESGHKTSLICGILYYRETMFGGHERYQTMRRSVLLTCAALGIALAAAANVYAASYSLRFQRSFRPRAGSQFTVKKYQRPMIRHRRFTGLRRIESRTTRFRNYMPTNQQVRSGRNRHYSRPERTRQSRDPSQRYAGRKRTRIRRRVRWAANR